MSSYLPNNLHTIWEVRLYFDAEGTYDFLGVGTRPRTAADGNYSILPLLAGEPTIRRSIDLKDCTAKVSNVTIELANAQYQAGTVWDELDPFNGTRKYLNRTATIREAKGSLSFTTLFTGRIRDIRLNKSSGTVSVTLEPNQPWDFISIPNVQASSGRWFPVVYGDFAYNSNVGAYQTYKAMFPVEVDAYSNEGLWALMPFATTSNTYRLHFYEEEGDVFVPLDDGSGNVFYLSTTGFDSAGDAIRVDAELIHQWKFKPARISADDPGEFSNPQYAIDVPLADDASSYASATVGPSGATALLLLEIPDSKLPPYDASAAEYQYVITTRLQFSRSGSPDPTVWLSVDGGSSFILQYVAAGTSAVDVVWTVDSSATDVQRLPSSIGLYAFIAGGSLACTVQVWDVRIEVVTQVDPSDLADAKRSKQDVKQLFCGGDGLSKSWSSGACSTLQEIHRDILIRYAGLSTSTPDGYAALDTARSGWNGRLWLHEPTEVREVLEQLQYEGQFIFTWSPSGAAKYIFVKASYSSGDVAATISESIDTDGITYEHTPLTELVTKQEIKYERHPADDSRYLSSETFTNSTARTNWNIQTKENIETVELDYLVAAADEWAEVRDAVLGDIHPTISFNLVRTRFLDLELGDIIQVEGDANYYMITDERRSRSGLGIKARRVG